MYIVFLSTADDEKNGYTNEREIEKVLDDTTDVYVGQSVVKSQGQLQIYTNG